MDHVHVAVVDAGKKFGGEKGPLPFVGLPDFMADLLFGPLFFFRERSRFVVYVAQLFLLLFVHHCGLWERMLMMARLVRSRRTGSAPRGWGVPVALPPPIGPSL